MYNYCTVLPPHRLFLFFRPDLNAILSKQLVRTEGRLSKHVIVIEEQAEIMGEFGHCQGPAWSGDDFTLCFQKE